MSAAPSAAPAPAARVDAAYWRARLAGLIGTYNVPGATLGILRDDQITDVAAGVLSKATLVEATPDAVFQLGSITKVWTATLVMRLVDEGALTLDTPVVEVLPDFALADRAASGLVTVRQLLTHTSGIDGDVYMETGRGDDCIEKYVARMDEVDLIHPVGAAFSYSNAAFVLAGRLVEARTGMTWDQALRELIYAPLGLTGTMTLPEEAILHRAAVGHVGGGAGGPVPTPLWVLPRSGGPAGRLISRVHDVLEFARTHLAGGRAPGGARVLSEAAARDMAGWQADCPDPNTGTDSWGLGWRRFDWGGHRLIGHNGGTIGQMSFLVMSPERRFAMALLCNGGDGIGLFEELFAEGFRELAGLHLPPPIEPPAEPAAVDLAPYPGRYRRAGHEAEVVEGADGLVLRHATTGLLARYLPGDTEEKALVPIAAGRFVMRSPGGGSWSLVRFANLPDGTRYLHMGGRLYPLDRA